MLVNDSLLDAVRRYVDTHAHPAGVIRTPVPGLSLIRSLRPTGLDYAISRPLVCLLLQGHKRVTLGAETVAFAAGDSLLISADVPTVSQITQASVGQPYLSLVMDLDLSLLADLMVEIRGAAGTSPSAMRVEPTDAETTDAALRLVRLLERPSALPVLQAQLVREMHYWLLIGRHGPAIRQLGGAGSHALRISRAVALLRREFAHSLRVEQLAAVAGMGLSSFHEHFRQATSLSPLQFQKQLRLIEARRLMTAESLSASSAAFAVGYESVQQFTREYRRLFGRPPGRDAEALRSEVSAAA